MGRADGLGSDQPGISQHPEVMGHGGLWSATVQFATAGFAQFGKASDDLQAHRIAQGV